MFVLVSLRMLLEKSAGERLCFSVTVSELAVTLRYSQAGSSVPLAVSFRTEGRISPQRWTHLSLQVTHIVGLGNPIGTLWSALEGRDAWQNGASAEMWCNHVMTFDLWHKHPCVALGVKWAAKQLCSSAAEPTVDWLASRRSQVSLLLYWVQNWNLNLNIFCFFWFNWWSCYTVNALIYIQLLCEHIFHQIWLFLCLLILSSSSESVPILI